MNLIHFEDAYGEYKCFSKQVVAKLADGTFADVMRAQTNVLNFWESYLAEIGVLKTAGHHEYDDGLGFQPRPANAAGPTFEVLQGVRFHQILHLMKFNPDTGRAEPMSFPEGTQVSGQIRKRPRHKVDITLRHDATGHELTRTITLTEDESEALDAAYEQDRQDLLNGFESMKRGFSELGAEIFGDTSGGESEASKLT